MIKQSEVKTAPKSPTAKSVPEGKVMFAMLNPTKPAKFFTGYRDNNGDMITFMTSKNKEGDFVPEKYVFNGERFLMGSKTRRCLQNESLSEAEFLSNHPECQGSPNARGVVSFKLYDPQAITKKRRDDGKSLMKAMTLVYGMSDEDRESLMYQLELNPGSRIGHEKKAHIEEVLIAQAQKNPDRIIEESKDVSKIDNTLKMHMARVLKKGTLKANDTHVMWGDQPLCPVGDTPQETNTNMALWAARNGEDFKTLWASAFPKK